MSTAILEEKIIVVDDVSTATTIDLVPKARKDLSIHFESFYGVKPRHVSPAFKIRGATLLEQQTASTYFSAADLPYQIPPFVASALLDLHYTSLVQARVIDLLSPSGVVMSSIGGRVPVATMLALADAAGFAGRILSMSWKVQSEPDSVIGGYATQQQKALGPFYVYRTTTLRRVFHGRTPAGAALRALQIERDLLPERIDAITALELHQELHQEGVELGHPVVVMASVLM
ncbi:hypothetical protein BO82DRAFT_432185 [Aspergillus uvarum CBS 121591]|uniref:Uncharacterized protein n=1 Tax=Aspergillus uvarum CBS 121591 TaxID=1448315 RepID=A0A319C957_9EURO|nr:hypothetical protein BO82DRAFT_432185 [Aspergillus uvarum CBS 121591]PYH81774.1 hypothetical protein BO82DRAFT_432185 [Aspergillus uvarum CBS 121591]